MIFFISSVTLSVYQQVRAALWSWLSFSQIFHHQMTDGMITVPQGLLLVNFGVKYNYIWRKRKKECNFNPKFYFFLCFLVFPNDPLISLSLWAVKDLVFEPFSQWVPEIVRVHSNGDTCNDSSLSASKFPLSQTHQPGFPDSQLGLHFPCGWCLYLCR